MNERDPFRRAVITRIGPCLPGRSSSSGTIRNVLLLTLLAFIVTYGNGCGTAPVIPVASLLISDTEIESGETISAEVTSDIPGQTSTYILRGSIDLGATLPLTAALPIDVDLTYENKTDAPVWKSLEAQVISSKGVASSKVSRSFTVNPEVVNPKPVATLWISDNEIESGESVRAKVTSNIPSETSTYILKGSVDLGATIPLTVSLPIDVNLTYENKTGTPVVKNLEAQVISDKDVASDKVSKYFTVNPEIVNPKPTALFEITPLEGESPLTVNVKLNSSLPDNTLEYIIEGSADKDSIIPFTQATPVDRNLVYENSTEAPVTKTLTAKVKSDKGVFSDEVSISFTVNPQVIEDYINLSGVVEDNETDSPIANAEVRFYRPDKSLITTTTTNSSGAWTADWLKYESDDKIIIQAGDYPDYFIRTTSIPNEDNSNVLVRAVPNDLEGFLEFMWETSAGSPWRFDSTNFQGFKILTQNPTGNGTFTSEEAENFQRIILDQNYKVDYILNDSDYPAVIDPSEPYTPETNQIYIISDTDLPIGEANIGYYGEGTITWGGEIRMNLTGISDWGSQSWLLHEIGHLIYPFHPSTVNSIMHTPSTKNEYQLLDIKGTYISNEPTFIRKDLVDKKIDYLPNILGIEWEFEGLIGYLSKR